MQVKQPTAVNSLLVVLFASLGAWTLWLLPLALRAGHGALAWTLLPAVLLTTSWWSVIHEAIHGLLFPDRRLNDTAGRILCILFGVAFHPVGFGHLFHHRRNRSELDRAEIYPV